MIGGRLPYPGLRAFRRDESDLFFGREGHVDAMVDRLTATRFLAVLGPSGGGKSSLVRTGLLDALDLGYSAAGASWCIADTHPGSQPITNLARALLGSCGGSYGDIDAAMLADLFLRGPRSVVEWAAAGNLAEGHNLLILVDQFEELFRYGDYAGREEAEAFVKILLEASCAPEVPIYVCLTMRSEYLGACALLPGLAEAINRGLYLTPRLTRDQCKEAVTGPAGVCRFDVEPALVNKILNDMASVAPWSDGPGENHLQRLSQRADQLPLMQHVLNRMWMRKAALKKPAERLLLTRADYDELGGLRGALDSHGDEILDGLGPGARERAARIFRALTSGNSLETAVRRPCRLQDLVAEQGGDRAATVAVVDAFRAPNANFLQPPYPAPIDDDTPIDISHESLIRQWSRLTAWFQTEAQSAATWRDLLSASRRYRDGRADLLSGLDLAQASLWWSQEQPTREWAERHGGDYDAVRDFLAASEALRDKELEAARLKTLKERNRLRLQLAASVAATVLVGGLGVFGWSSYQSANEQKQEIELQRAAIEERRAEAAGLASRLGAERQQLLTTQQQLRGAIALSEEEKRAKEAEARRAAEQTRMAQAQRQQAQAAQQSAEAARAKALRLERESRQQIERIGSIIVGSDASFEASSRKLREELARELAPRLPRMAQWAPDGEIPATKLRRDIAEVLEEHVNSLAANPDTHIREKDRLASLLRLYEISERSGDLSSGNAAVKRAWQLAERMIARRSWASLDPDERTLLMRAAYKVAWDGQETGLQQEAEQALRRLREIGSSYDPDDPEVRRNPDLAVQLSFYENLEASFYSDRALPEEPERARRHAMRALAYVESAAAARPAEHRSDVTSFALRERRASWARNDAIRYRGEGYKARVASMCTQSEALFAERPLDERAILRLQTCASEALRTGSRDHSRSLQVIRATQEALRLDPGNQVLRLLQIEAAVDIIKSMRGNGRCTGECRTLLDTGFDSLEQLVSGGVESFAAVGETLSGLAGEILDAFGTSEERLEKSERLLTALRGSARRHGGRELNGALARTLMVSAFALRDLGRREEAASRMLEATRFHRSRPIPETVTQLDIPEDECWRERQLASIQTRPEDLLETISAVRRYCEATLNKVPWNIYLRDEIAETYGNALRRLPEEVRPAHAVAFHELFYRASTFPFRYMRYFKGSVKPELVEIMLQDWSAAGRSAVTDVAAIAHNWDHDPRPSSGFEYLRAVEAAAAPLGMDFATAAGNYWAEAMRSVQVEGAPDTEEELDRVYRKAMELLAAEGAAGKSMPAAPAPTDPTG